jgi:hypothetical protein
MAEAVYLLCALTSAVCAVLLIRSFRQNRGRLLLWSSLCFIGLALNNILLFVDLVVVPSIDLSIWRSSTALAGLLTLIFGLVWESK